MKENPEGIKDHLSISGKVSHFPLSTKHLAKSATGVERHRTWMQRERKTGGLHPATFKDAVRHSGEMLLLFELDSHSNYTPSLPGF